MSALSGPAFRRSVFILFAAALFIFSSQANRPAMAGSVKDQAAQLESIRKIAENFQGQLGIEQRIDVAVVPNEPRLVSVRRVEGSDAFVLTFDETFLTLLSDEEIRAAIAHEFGHLWIFTHHPYLQTEELANRKALLLVSAESLEKVYQRVLHCGGVRQNVPSSAPDKAGEAGATKRGASVSN